MQSNALESKTAHLKRKFYHEVLTHPYCSLAPSCPSLITRLGPFGWVPIHSSAYVSSSSTSNDESSVWARSANQVKPSQTTKDDVILSGHGFSNEATPATVRGLRCRGGSGGHDQRQKDRRSNRPACST